MKYTLAKTLIRKVLLWSKFTYLATVWDNFTFTCWSSALIILFLERISIHTLICLRCPPQVEPVTGQVSDSSSKPINYSLTLWHFEDRLPALSTYSIRPLPYRLRCSSQYFEYETMNFTRPWATKKSLHGSARVCGVNRGSFCFV